MYANLDHCMVLQAVIRDMTGEGKQLVVASIGMDVTEGGTNAEGRQMSAPSQDHERWPRRTTRHLLAALVVAVSVRRHMKT